MNETESLKKMVSAALFAALTAAGAYVAIPIGPVPIVLQNLFVLLAGLMLGARWAMTSMGVYLVAGLCGLPVFHGGSGGLGILAGPTGGYLIGFVPAAAVVGWLAPPGSRQVGRDAVAVSAGVLIIYAFGVPWLKMVTGMPWSKALIAGAAPFIAGDCLKAAAAVVVAKKLDREQK
jgi:biotin transport system substrate-specific component